MKTQWAIIALALATLAWAGTPEQAATDAALAAERAAVVPPAGAAWTDVQAELQASESRMHQYVTHEYAVLTANLLALWGTTPIEPPIEPPDPGPAPTGAIEIGDSGYRSTVPHKTTPDFHGHSFCENTGPLWTELCRTVTADTVDPKSAQLIGMMSSVSIHMDFFGTDNSTTPPTVVGPYWGLPVTTADGDATKVTIDVPPGGYVSESDQPISAQMPGKPAIEGWLYTAGNAVGAAPNNTPPTLADIQASESTDHHLLLAVRDETTGAPGDLYEFSKPYWDGSLWHARQISRFPVDGTPRREGWTSTDAAGLPRYPLLPRYDECVTGVMAHPLATTFNVGMVKSRYIWPARHMADGGNGLPFGARLRMTSTYYNANKANFTGCGRVIFQAMRDYGLINADIGGTLFLMGVSDDRFDHANLMTLQSIPATAFEVLRMIPQFELTGPATVAVGVPTTYTFKFNPPIEMNGQHGYYLHAYRKNADGVTWARIADNAASGVLPHQVTYTTPTINAPNVTFVAPSAGAYLIEVDQAGEAKLEWTDPIQITTTTDGVRGPYPMLPVTAQ